MIDPAGRYRARERNRIMKLPTSELLLALRSPNSGWLAAMVCALQEAVQDPDFSDHHRDLVAQLLGAKSIPAPIAAAAEERLAHFEQSVADTQRSLLNEILDTQPAVAPAQPARPKLTLVGSVAA
ncbi:MAG TPA: hypothetical protein VFB32_14520 [Rudaea sp.]|nr:hypothetical protein [Rudaea sp.]